MDAPRQQKIVVGVDASNEAAAALRWALDRAKPDDIVVAVHAWSVPYAAQSTSRLPVDPVGSFDATDYEQVAKQELHRLVAPFDDGRVTPVLCQGRPGAAIAAEGNDADMMVVGHRGENQISMMLGSTANYVLHHARRPVVVVHGDRPGPARRVIVGVDDHDISRRGDNESVHAVAWAYGLPGVERIEVLHGWSLQPLAMGLYGGNPIDPADIDAAADAVIARVMDAAGDPPAGVEVSRRVARDTGARALIEASRDPELDADLVVVGSRGRGGFRGLVLGSTSAEVAAHCRIPVAVVR